MIADPRRDFPIPCWSSGQRSAKCYEKDIAKLQAQKAALLSALEALIRQPLEMSSDGYTILDCCFRTTSDIYKQAKQAIAEAK